MTNTLPFILVAGCALCQWISLLLASHKKPSVWKVGILFGMGGSGWAAAGFASHERLNPLPWHTFGLATLFMLNCLAVTYYKANDAPEGATDGERHDARERQQRALFRAGIGIIATLCVAVVVAFMDGQRAGDKMQEKSVVVLSDVVKVLERLQRTAIRNSGRLDARDRADSLFKQTSLVNQTKTLSNQDKIMHRQTGDTRQRSRSQTKLDTLGKTQKRTERKVDTLLHDTPVPPARPSLLKRWFSRKKPG